MWLLFTSSMGVLMLPTSAGTVQPFGVRIGQRGCSAVAQQSLSGRPERRSGQPGSIDEIDAIGAHEVQFLREALL
jgi:hypothetical protein